MSKRAGAKAPHEQWPPRDRTADDTHTAKAKAKEWLAENSEAFSSWADYVDAHEMPLARHRAISAH